MGAFDKASRVNASQPDGVSSASSDTSVGRQPQDADDLCPSCGEFEASRSKLADQIGVEALEFTAKIVLIAGQQIRGAQSSRASDA
jgi:hypothetical protein